MIRTKDEEINDAIDWLKTKGYKVEDKGNFFYVRTKYGKAVLNKGDIKIIRTDCNTEPFEMMKIYMKTGISFHFRDSGFMALHAYSGFGAAAMDCYGEVVK